MCLRLRHIINFSFHQFGIFGIRWWHGLGTFMLVVGCFSTAAYIIGEYFVQNEAYVMVGSSTESELATFECDASEYCRFTNLHTNRTMELVSGSNISLQANTTVWLVELLTRSEFRVRRQAFSLKTALGDGEFDIQSFPPVEQLILMKFTLSLTRDYRTEPVQMEWTIVDWQQYDVYQECMNTSLGFDGEISYTCGAFELHFSPETYAKRYRVDQELANTAFFVAGSWLVNLSWMWVLVHGLDVLLRVGKDLEKLDKRQ